jgi:hypothetical protein
MTLGTELAVGLPGPVGVFGRVGRGLYGGELKDELNAWEAQVGAGVTFAI